MLSLLDRCTRSGYPSEYIVSRIRGKMEAGVFPDQSAWEMDSNSLAEDEHIWNAANDGYKWIYLQMNGFLREVLAPLLFYFELDTLVYCLRRLAAFPPEDIDGEMQKSLLAKELKHIVMIPAPVAGIIERLEIYLEKSLLDVKGLATVFDQKGIQGCEELLRSRFLSQSPGLCRHPQLKAFFCRIIDLRNIMTLAKYLQWENMNAPKLISGGHIHMMKNDRAPSAAGLEKMVRRFTGGWQLSPDELYPVNLESLLVKDLSKRMARQERSDDPVVCCMGYVYRCNEVARERSKVYHAGRFAEQFPTGSETVS